MAATASLEGGKRIRGLEEVEKGMEGSVVGGGSSSLGKGVDSKKGRREPLSTRMAQKQATTPAFEVPESNTTTTHTDEHPLDKDDLHASPTHLNILFTHPSAAVKRIEAQDKRLALNGYGGRTKLGVVESHRSGVVPLRSLAGSSLSADVSGRKENGGLGRGLGASSTLSGAGQPPTRPNPFRKQTKLNFGQKKA